MTRMSLVVLSVIFLSGLVLSIAFQRFCFFRKPRRFVPDLSLLIVVHDQAPIIEGVIKDILSYYQSSRRSFELVIYDDASTDDTPEILGRLCRRQNFTLLRDQEPCDCSALEAGFAVCRGKVIHYFLLNERVLLKTVTSLARCLSRGDRIPDFGVACSSGVMSESTIQQRHGYKTTICGDNGLPETR